jgi:hypothetical protein
MEVYSSGGDDAWSERLMEDALGDEKSSWRML